MDFDYVLADPTGNVTVLITSPYTENTRASMIQEAFAKEPACEQVGFVMPCGDKRIRIEMMAYEFCGNATLSSAALLMHSSAPSTGSEDTVTVDSSGAGRPVVVSLRRLPDLEENVFIRKAQMGENNHQKPDEAHQVYSRFSFLDPFHKMQR